MANAIVTVKLSVRQMQIVLSALEREATYWQEEGKVRAVSERQSMRQHEAQAREIITALRG